jgi:small subunit ribosomal protein S4e
MSKAHIKRYVAPKTWTILRKKEKFVVRPNPGAHIIKQSIPITLLLKQLGYAKTTREVKKMLNTKEIFVDHKRVKDYKRPVGFMDVLSIKDTKEHFRILMDYKGRLTIMPIKDEKEASLKICRVNDKTVIQKGKIQLNLSGNRNLIIEKNDYKTGDSVLLEIPSQKITQHIKLEKGALICLTAGTHVGSKGVVDSIEQHKILFRVDGAKKETLKKYALVIGKGKEIITIS